MDAALEQLILERLAADDAVRWVPQLDGGRLLQMTLGPRMTIHAPTGAMLWRNDEVAGNYHIGLRHNVAHFYEGDLLLAFFRQDVLLFQLSFSVVPGGIVGEAAPHVLFVGGAQGAAPERGENHSG